MRDTVAEPVLYQVGDLFRHAHGHEMAAGAGEVVSFIGHGSDDDAEWGRLRSLAITRPR